MTGLHLTSCTTADIAEAHAHRVVADRPCPFCGGGAVADSMRTDDFVQHYMRCRSCACEGPWTNTPNGAVDAWNRRAVSAHDDLAAALAEMVRWFGDYPEYIPNPERCDEYKSVVAAARAAIARAEGATP